MITMIETIEHGSRLGRKQVVEDRQTLCGAQVIRVTIPLKQHWSGRRRVAFLSKVFTELHGRGVRRAITPQGFAYQTLLRRHGIVPPDDARLRRALAPLYIEYALRNCFSDSRDISALVCAARRSRECDEVVLTLLSYCRRVAVRLERGDQSDYAAALYAAHGATLLATADAVDTASLCVMLDHFHTPPLGAVTIDCSAFGAVIKLPERFAHNGFDTNMVAAELYRCGVLKRQDIEIVRFVHTNSLDICSTTHYNIAQSYR